MVPVRIKNLTLPRDFHRRDEIAVVILELSDLVAWRAHQGGYTGRVVSLVLKDNNFSWLGRSRTLKGYTDLTEDLYEAGLLLLDRHWPGRPRLKSGDSFLYPFS